MVGRRVSQDHPKLNDAISYINAVKEAFQSGPAKFNDFTKILHYVITHREDEAICFAGLQELMKDHPNLLHGVNVFFRRPEAKKTIPPPDDANKELTMGDAHSYIVSVKEAFRDEPGKFQQFLMVLKDYQASRFDTNSTIARVKELMKGHQKLLLGFISFFSSEGDKIQIPPKAKITKRTIPTIPREAKRTTLPKAKIRFLPEANKESDQFQTMVVRGVPLPPKLTIDDERSYITSVTEAFHDQPEKCIQFSELLNDIRSNRVNRSSAIARVVELMKDHQKLLPGFSVFLPKANITTPPEANRTIPPKAKRIIPHEAKRTIPPVAKRTIPPKANRTDPHEDKRAVLPKLNTTILLKAKRTNPPGANPHDKVSNT